MAEFVQEYKLQLLASRAVELSLRSSVRTATGNQLLFNVTFIFNRPPGLVP